MKVYLKILPVILSILFLAGYILHNITRSDATFEIKIRNNTSSAVSDLKITYDKIEKNIFIPVIPPKSSYALKISPRERFGENSMWIFYKDKKGEIHKEAIFGYFEKGYSGKALIDIENFEKNGIIQFEIKSKVKI